MTEGIAETRQRLKKNKIAKKVLGQADLPVLPQILDRLEQELSKREADAASVARLVENEPVIAGRLIKVANSALLGGRDKITDLRLAVSRLGMNRIRQIVYSLVLPQLFLDVHMVDHTTFWKHSLAVANLSRRLAVEFANTPNIGDQAYMAGIVHDIGVLLMAMAITDEYSEIIQMAYAEERSLVEVEFETLELTHQEIGALFVQQKWRFDDDVADAIVLHEFAPEVQPRNPIADAVYVADRICIAAGLTNGTLGDPKTQMPEPMKHLEEMGVAEQTQEKLVEIAKELSTSLDSFL